MLTRHLNSSNQTSMRCSVEIKIALRFAIVLFLLIAESTWSMEPNFQGSPDANHKNQIFLGQCTRALRKSSNETQPLDLLDPIHLAELYRFLYDSHPRGRGAFEFLKSTERGRLEAQLSQDPRLPNKLALEVQILEERGLTPPNPKSVVAALQGLSSQQRQREALLCEVFQDCVSRPKDPSLGCPLNHCLPKPKITHFYRVDGSRSELLYFEYPVFLDLWNYPLLLWEQQNLEVDEGTRAIRAQNDAGVTFINQLLAATKLESRTPTPWLFIFFDINDLNVINNMEGGQATGDAFLSGFAQNILKHLESSDYFFRLGGDEFAIITPFRNEAAFNQKLDRMIHDFYTDPMTNALLEKNWNFRQRAIDSIDQFTNYSELHQSPYSVVLKPSWLELAQSNFGEFKRTFTATFKPELQKGLQLQRYIVRPTYAIGVKIIDPGDTFVGLKSITSILARESKKNYKMDLGINSIKAGGEETNLHKIEHNLLENKEIYPRAVWYK